MSVMFWFRNDLRLADNPGLCAAVAAARTRKCPLVLVYVLDDENAGNWAMGGASRWWLYHSLTALQAALGASGAGLVLRRGDAQAVMPALVAECATVEVHWNRRYTPWGQEVDRDLKELLRDHDVEVGSHKANLLFEPWEMKTQSGGGPFKVYTPFWNTCLKRAGEIGEPLGAPKMTGLDFAETDSDPLPDWGLRPGDADNREPDWTGELARTWQPGEDGAKARLDSFLSQGLHGYKDGRDVPARENVSRLSPHLHHGEISVRQVWQAVHAAKNADQADVTKLASELGWREFSHHLLGHFPALPDEPFKPQFNHFAWRNEPAMLAAWQRGRTGIPFVDAGMRQLWRTGWMHNRMRLITASFLIKHLGCDWRLGAQWFWDTLVDADLANNSMGWQWVAGSGADASPYFRIFNPVEQGKRFDAAGDYIRQWCPELQGLGDRDIHAPWDADAAALAKAGVVLGKDYPRPVITLKEGREAALAAFAEMRTRSQMDADDADGDGDMAE